MKLVVPGGSGQVGGILARACLARGDDVVVLSRGGSGGAARVVPCDGGRVGDRASELDGADAVINLAGRSVNCRYTERNRQQMMSSRVDSTHAVGEAIARRRPARAWLHEHRHHLRPPLRCPERRGIRPHRR